MRYMYLTITIVLMTFILSCTPFSTRYERIEPNKIRPLSVIYSPFPEGAPGDTIRLRLHCAGQAVAGVSWQMSYDVVTNAFGSDTSLNWRTLDTVSTMSYLPDSMDVTFVIPESTFYKTVAIENTLKLIRPALPAGMQAMSQGELAALVDDFASLDLMDPLSFTSFITRWGSVLGSSNTDSLFAATSILTSVFSIKAYIFGDLVTADGNRLRVKSDLVIRYNTKLAANPITQGFISINHNPVIKWMGIYKVAQEGLFTFDPLDPQYKNRYTMQYIYNVLDTALVNDTVEIDAGYSYFVVVDSGYYKLPVRDTGRLVEPLAMQYAGSAFIKTSKVRVKYPISTGDTVGIPAVVATAGTVTCYLTGSKRVLPSFHNAGDTIIKAGPGDSIMIDTSVAQPGTPVPPAWLNVHRSDFRMYVTDRDIGVVPGGSADLETYVYDWLYQNVDADSATLPLDSLFTLIATDQEIAPLLPSQDVGMRRGKIWTVVYDFFLGEPNRPVGFAQVQSDVYFRYLDAYRDTMKK